MTVTRWLSRGLRPGRPAPRGAPTVAAPHPSPSRSTRQAGREPGPTPQEKPPPGWEAVAGGPPSRVWGHFLRKGAFRASSRVSAKWPHSGPKVKRPECARAGEHKGFTSNLRTSCPRGWQSPIPRGMRGGRRKAARPLTPSGWGQPLALPGIPPAVGILAGHYWLR